MEVDMLLDDLIDEEEAVVVSLVVVDRHVVTIHVECTVQLGKRESVHELVARANIDVARRHSQGATLLIKDISDRVVLASLSTAEVSFKGFRAECLASGWLADGRHCGNRAVALGKLGGADKGTIATHAETHNGSTLRVNMEVALNQIGKLLSDIGEHVEVLAPGFLSRVAVMTCTIANGPVRAAGLWAVSIDITGARVWHDHDDTTLSALTGIVHLACGIVLCTGETTAEIDGWVGLTTLLLDVVLRQEDRESHLALVDMTPVLNSLDKASSTLDRASDADVIGLRARFNSIDVHNTSQAFALMHCMDEVVNLVQAIKLMSNKLIEW